jgi:hypothetical protein
MKELTIHGDLKALIDIYWMKNLFSDIKIENLQETVDKVMKGEVDSQLFQAGILVTVAYIQLRQKENEDQKEIKEEVKELLSKIMSDLSK